MRKLWYLASHAPVAQSVEQLPFKERVEGSIPPGRTNERSEVLCARNEPTAWLMWGIEQRSHAFRQASWCPDQASEAKH